MSKNMTIVGYGPGTAAAVAEKFGANGFSLALVGRNAERLDAAVAALKAKGIDAHAFVADAAQPSSIQAAMQTARTAMGPVSVLFWNAFSGLEFGDLLAADAAPLQHLFDATVFGLIAAAREVHADLKSNGGAILVSNGGLAHVSTQGEENAVRFGFMGLALSSAAKDKLAGLLAQKLKGDGIFVGEVIVEGAIRTPGSTDANTIEPSAIAEAHWKLYRSRSETRASVS